MFCNYNEVCSNADHYTQVCMMHRSVHELLLSSALELGMQDKIVATCLP